MNLLMSAVDSVDIEYLEKKTGTRCIERERFVLRRSVADMECERGSSHAPPIRSITDHYVIS